MRRKLTSVLALALVALAAGVTALLTGFGVSTHAASGIASFADVISACSSSQDSSGFGSATLTRSLTVSGQTATMAVPCTIHLTQGAALTIKSSTITTSKLIVSDDSPGTSGSSFVLQNATLTGSGASGLLVQLQHASDAITVDKSTVTYPLSVYLLIENTDGSGTAGAIEANHDTITSNGPNSEGIHLVADGTGKFSSLTLQTNYAEDENLALLYAPQCSVQAVTGAPAAC